mmetsp:Transcript_18643/g.55287  ORF Transcript_18643/g.55287 Transcript_18643/m.55287 type:complete len:212 (-) Transcript_18643:499-1134(-)
MDLPDGHHAFVRHTWQFVDLDRALPTLAHGQAVRMDRPVAISDFDRSSDLCEGPPCGESEVGKGAHVMTVNAVRRDTRIFDRPDRQGIFHVLRLVVHEQPPEQRWQAGSLDLFWLRPWPMLERDVASVGYGVVHARRHPVRGRKLSGQPREIREEPIHEELLQYSPKPVHGFYHKVFLAHLLGHRWVAPRELGSAWLARGRVGKGHSADEC